MRCFAVCAILFKLGFAVGVARLIKRFVTVLMIELSDQIYLFEMLDSRPFPK